MKKVLLILAVVVFSFCYQPVGATTYHVYPGPGNPIQTAINNAGAGDTILVHAGTYTGQITLNKDDLTLRSSDGAAATIIDFTGVWCGYWSTGVGGVDILYGIRGVTVEGFTIFGGSPASDALISIGGDNNIIRNNVVIGDPSSSGQDVGIHIGNVAETSEKLPSGNKVVGNDVYNHAGSGIFVGNWAGIDNIVSGNRVHDNVIGGIPGLNGNGIEADRVLGLTVTKNIVYNNEAAGIKVVRTAPNAIIKINCNSLTGNDSGVMSESWRPGATTSAIVVINSNNIVGNITFGVRNDENVLIDGGNNWWGDASGPYHLLLNPTGSGDDVSDNVDFTPWGVVPVVCASNVQWGNPPMFGDQSQICPLAFYNIEGAETLLDTVQGLFDDAQILDLDTSEVEELLNEAAKLLEEATVFCRYSQNCIAGNILAIEAQNLLEEAKELLELMLA